MSIYDSAITNIESRQTLLAGGNFVDNVVQTVDLSIDMVPDELEITCFVGEAGADGIEPDQTLKNHQYIVQTKTPIFGGSTVIAEYNTVSGSRPIKLLNHTRQRLPRSVNIYITDVTNGADVSTGSLTLRIDAIRYKSTPVK